MQFNSDSKKKYRGVKSLSYALDIVTKPVFLKRGFAENRIITDWKTIVGESISACSIPRKLTFAQDKKSNGTLYIEVSNSSFATEMVYIEPMILERIACYFGYKAVSRLKIQQNPKIQETVQKKTVTKKNMSEEEFLKLEQSIADIEDPELKASLLSLGMNIVR